MKIFALCFITSLISISVIAKNENTEQIPPVMYEMMGHLYRIQPYLFSDELFSKPESKEAIGTALKGLAETSKRLPHSQRLSSSGFQVSAIELQKLLKETSSAFHDGKTEYARRLLNGTLDGCSSCHAQVPGKNLPQWTFRQNELKGDSFAKAEFLFAVRHYQEASQHFSQFVQSFDSAKTDPQFVETALRRQLVIFVRIKKNPQEGIDVLKVALKNPKIPLGIRRQVQGWIAGLKKLQQTSMPHPMKASRAEIEAYASKALQPILSGGSRRFDPSSTVSFLAASGLIFEFLNNRDAKDLSPELFYWLALSDAELSTGYFFSLTENYLRECIQRFPKDPGAWKCFDQLEASLTAAYTGSQGTAVPSDVTQDLNKLRKMMAPRQSP
jgi:hypothetical protein